MKKWLIPFLAVAIGAAAFVTMRPQPEMIDASARFADVGDLAKDAPVMMSDIIIGKVTGISLVGNEALVTMELDPEAEVPAEVTARVRRTSVLGERVVDLTFPEDLPQDAALLKDGDEIAQTETRSDLEDLVDEGAELLGAITASDLAIMIEEGARGFGGQGAQLKQLLQNFSDIVTAYDRESDDIISMIESMNSFNQQIAAKADVHRQAIANSARSIEVLKEETDELEDAIVSLTRLAEGGKDILADHSEEMDRFFRQMRTILAVLVEEQNSIRLALKYAPNHNANTQRVEYAEFNQVFQEFIICGLNDDPKDKARRCTKRDH